MTTHSWRRSDYINAPPGELHIGAIGPTIKPFQAAMSGLSIFTHTVSLTIEQFLTFTRISCYFCFFGTLMYQLAWSFLRYIIPWICKRHRVLFAFLQLGCWRFRFTKLSDFWVILCFWWTLDLELQVKPAVKSIAWLIWYQKNYCYTVFRRKAVRRIFIKWKRFRINWVIHMGS